MITSKQYDKLADEFGIDKSKILAIVEVESSGSGFDPATGLIKIQFEPSRFKRFTRFIIPNGVEKQAAERKAFSKAFAKNPDKAMQSTSWGMMQVMGFHYARLGFKSVGAMVDFAKKSEYNQVWLGLKFIATDKRTFDAVQRWDVKKVALYYNGKNYWIKGYDKKLANAEANYRVYFANESKIKANTSG